MIGDDLLLETQKQAIEELERILADVRAGKAIEIVGMEVRPNGDTAIFGGCTANRHQMAGMLMDLAMSRIIQSNDYQDEEDDDEGDDDPLA